MAKETPKSTNIIFSYFPLLTGSPGTSYLGEEARQFAEAVSGKLDELPSGSARGCLWMVDDGETAMVLAMEDTAAIAEHFGYWSEGKPEEWFAFHYLEKGLSYAGALMPNFLKTSERWKIAFQLRHGYPPIPGSESLMFRPLHFVGKTKQAFDAAKEHLGEKLRVGLIEMKELEDGQFLLEKQGLQDKILWLGRFRAVAEKKKGIAHGWLDAQIEAMWEDEGKP